MQNALEVQKIIGQVSALAIMDESLKARLSSEPLTVLREHGLELPEEMPAFKVKVLGSYEELPPEAASGDTLYLVVPELGELSHEELSMVVGASISCQSTASTACTALCVSTASSFSTNSCT
jgi:hypothetical protein